MSKTASQAMPHAPAEETLPGGSLLESLLLVARAHNLVTSRETLLAGLPLTDGQLTPALLSRAAQRAGLTTKLATRELTRLNNALFPAILLLDNQDTCLLLAIQDQRAQVVFPELGEASVWIALNELNTRYSGRAVYLRPQERIEARTAPIDKGADGHWFWGVIRRHRGLYRDVLLAAFLINLFAVAMPLFVMNVYDRVVPNHATDTLWMLAAGIVLVMCADAALRMMRGWFIDMAASRTDITLSATIMERVLGMKMTERPASIGSFASGLQAFESVRSFIGSATVVGFIDLPFVLLFTLVMGLISWPLVIPVLIGIALVLLYTAGVQHKMHQLSEQSMQASAQRNAVLVESLVGLETLKTLGAEGRMQSLWEKTTLLLSRTSVKMRMLSGSVTAGTLWIQQAVAVAIIILGVYLIIDAQLSQGALIAAYMLSSRVMAPVGQAAALLMQYHQAATALETLEAVMQKPVERPPGTSWISRPRLQGGIEFNEVSFRYPHDERDVLRSVSFKINPGEHVAILGRNGSGKTTLEKLVAGLYSPTQGAVLIDGIDARQLDPAELRRNIGYVSQDVNLFFGSLRDNIVMGAPQVDDARVLEAVRLSGLAEFVQTHPAGLAMPVGERGELLSGGQRQGVTIARAMLNDPSILLFDEPTGAMDHASEELFKRNIREYAPGKTLLVITHRTSLLELVDRIIVIDAGKIVADGSKDQVVEALRQGRIGRAS
ncbi:type I secretion system permease/ATPase [Cellvibrio sp. PSBB006]|uniref:type I secretion system permease/ATPase n=1 Tax=Cellvibrio sp. PSBB006 TaxID=1987723 RepID=UPI000B3BA16B|nr:type I secretion system permease/ATPase [Cellvibrio sp. PSBB006]ARU26145.1 type I secretion system permease/ATPase [Cellvibrio sp. PSBB006]